MIKSIRDGPCIWIVLAWIILCLYVSPSVQASETSSGIRIDQGQCVEPNQTIDIAGLGWYSGYIEYFGRYYDGYGIGDPNELQALYHVKAMDLKHFWLDPSYFGDKYGWWYSGYNPNASVSSAGYDRLFYVAEHCNITVKQKQKVVQEILNESQMLAAMRANITALPIKQSGYDIVISKGLTTNLEAKGGTHRWVFGSAADDGIYDVEVFPWNVTVFDAQTTWNMKSGLYTVLFVSAGKNGVLEETYNAGKGVIESPFRSQQDTDIRGFDPQTVKDRLVARVASSYDDSITSWNLLLEDPKIEVAKIDYRTLQNNHTMVAIAGYSNADTGDTLKIQMDVDKGVALDAHTWYAEVVNNGGMSAYRSWNSSFIFNTQDENPGEHTFTVTNEETGATATVPFYIFHEPAAHYRPEAELQYIGNSPFLEPPAPEIIVKEVPGPVQTVVVHDTPSPDEILAVSDQSAWSVGSTIIIWEAIAVVLILAGLWIRSAYRRARNG